MFFTQPTVEAGTEQGRNVSEWLSQVHLLSFWPAKHMLNICPEHMLNICPQNILKISQVYLLSIWPEHMLNICPQNIWKILVLDWIGYNEDVSGPT